MDKNTYKFIEKQTNNPIIERRTCLRTGEEFAVYQSDIDLLDRISPTIGGEKISFPLPTLSPESRLRRMMMFRNERTLYKRKCDKTWNTIISLYPQQYEGKIYSPNERWSDNRDPLAFGKDYTPWKFYEDLKDLFTQVPFLNMFAFNNENSDYTNGSEGNKNCYMIFASDHNEDCYYSYSILKCKSVVDCYGCKWCENSYQAIDSIDSMKVIYSQNIENSFNVIFSYNIQNCKNTFLCTDLKDKEYYFMNQYVWKERRENEIEPMIQNIFKNREESVYAKKLEDMKKSSIVKNMNIINTENGIWDLISNSKNIRYSFEAHDTEDINGVINTNNCKDIMWWYVVVDWSQKVHEWVWCAANYATSTVRNSRTPVKNTHFSNFIMNSQNMFGVVSCRNKEYCILNKQYSKEDREKTAKQIAKELQDNGKRGEFFDPEFSPFPYNDTVAMEYYPVTADQLTILEPEKFISNAILDLGWEQKIKIKWRTQENEINIPENIQTIKKTELPSNIKQIEDDIISKAIICEVTERPFRISMQELHFYRKNGLPIPTKHPDLRHKERLQKRPGRDLYIRRCNKCNQEMLSTYKQDSTSKVYCETCYNQEKYS